jgi:peptidoglycan/LPS O-acetylase OafA/YrhL
LARWMESRLLERFYPTALSVSLLLFVIAQFLFYQRGLKVSIGRLIIYGYRDVSNMLLHDVLILSGFFIILLVCRMMRPIKVLEVMGRFSLQIYLLHSLVFQTLAMVITKLFDVNRLDMRLIVVTTFVMTIIISYHLSVIITRMRLLNNVIFPRSYKDLRNITATVR